MNESKPEKKQKPFYKRTWFIVVVVFVVLSLFAGRGKTSTEDSEPSASTTISSTTASEVVTVDKTTAQDVVDSARDITNVGYTDESWQALQEAIANADAVLADEAATQSEVDEAADAVTAAVSNLFAPDMYASPSYDDIARNPDNWNQQLVQFTGTVIQVIDGTGETDLRVAVDDDYESIILVAYDPDIMNGSRILENDNITVYGTSNGIYTYEAITGMNVSAPLVIGTHIIVN
jgi:hypothetical protein